MKKASLYNLAIAASICFATVSCNSPTNTPTATSPSASVPTATSPTAKPTTSPSAASPSASPVATPSASPSPSAKPSEAAKPKEAIPDTVRIAVINNSGKILKAIYMAAPSSQDWGVNELESPIADRDKADFEWKRSDYKGADAGCLFEVRAEYDDGKSAELEAIDLCKNPAINLK